MAPPPPSPRLSSSLQSPRATASSDTLHQRHSQRTATTTASMNMSNSSAATPALLPPASPPRVTNARRRVASGAAFELLSDDLESATTTHYVSGSATAGALCLTPARHLVAGESEQSSAHRFRVDTPSQLRQRFIQIQVVDQRFKEPSWMHPNIGGEAQHVHAAAHEVDAIRRRLQDAPRAKLSEWPSTAIGGNDVLSSVLFSAGLTSAKAGKLAPVVQVVVVVVVYCLRFVFEEVVSAVPLNGGCYNAILSSSTKRAAAVAATFSILSYVATGVVCGVSAFNYVNYLWHVPVVACTVAMLLAFALLCLVGIAESAVVALAFFVFHGVTLTVLAVACAVYAVQHPSVFVDNVLHTALPDVSVFGRAVDGSVVTALVMGYAPALLSVTGFESSAQFVEEQAPGVFPKTLRNMWRLSSVFNVAFSVLALAVVPLDAIGAHKEVLLAHMGRRSSGHWLELLVTIDAFVVLSGAVLTSYVGINGLVQRLAIDRVLPVFLLKQNAWRGTNHWIILSYFAVASSLVVLLDAQIDALSGVFAFAFFGVLAAFATSCLALKVAREDMPRAHTTSWPNALFCFAMLVLGLLSNAMGDPQALQTFAIYFAACGAVIAVMLERVRVLQALLFVSRKLLLYVRARRAAHGESAPAATESARGFVGSVAVAKTIETIKKTPVVFFCKAPNLPKINEAIAYVLRNEQTYCLRLVHICGADETPPRSFEDIVCLFDHIYPLLKIDFVSITGAFEPAMVEWIAASMAIPTNMMFMRQPANAAIHRVAALGVRVITN